MIKQKHVIALFSIVMLIAMAWVSTVSVKAQEVINLRVGEIVELETVINLPELNKEAQGLKIKWTTSDRNVATIDYFERIYAKGEGVATFYGTINDKPVAELNVQVVSTVTGVEIDKQEVTLKMGDAQRLNASVLPEDAFYKKVTWSSSNSKVVRVSNNGTISAIGLGEAVVTAKTADGGYEAYASITVKPAVDGISVTDTDFSIQIGESTELPIEVDTESDKPKLNYEVADKTVASIDYFGKVKGLKEGETSITITTLDGQHSATVNVAVISDVESLSFANDKGEMIEEINLKVGEPLQLHALGNNIPLNGYKVAWMSTDMSVAKIDTRGLVTGMEEGTTTITFTIPQELTPLKATIVVNVESTVESVEIVQQNVEISVGGTAKLEALVFPETAYLKDVTWKSANNGIAMVNRNGEVKGVKEGSVEITAITKDGQKVATTTVRVVGVAEGIQVSTTDIKVHMGDVVTFTASVFPDETLVKTIETKFLTYDGSSLVKVIKGEDGLYTINGLKPGTTTLQLRSKDGHFVKDISIEVLETDVEVEIYDQDGTRLY